MTTHTMPATVRPFSPAHPRSTGWIARTVGACFVALTLAGLVGTAQSRPVAATAPGETKPVSVPNLSPGNAEIDIDAFWREIFTAAGVAYSAPAVIPFATPVSSGCGYVTPAEVIAFYCAADVAVYWSTPSYDAAYIAGGDAAWVNVMAHEWSHHAQVLLGTNTPWNRANDIVNLELEATCMGGVYVADARTRDLVDDAMIATMVGMFVGSPFHGSTEQVQAAFLGGLDSGISACGLALPDPIAPVADATTSTDDAATKPEADADTATTDTRVTAAAVNLRTAPSPPPTRSRSPAPPRPPTATPGTPSPTRRQASPATSPPNSSPFNASPPRLPVSVLPSVMTSQIIVPPHVQPYRRGRNTETRFGPRSGRSRARRSIA